MAAMREAAQAKFFLPYLALRGDPSALRVCQCSSGQADFQTEGGGLLLSPVLLVLCMGVVSLSQRRNVFFRRWYALNTRIERREDTPAARR